jgi:processive 1,2-diacylglycerol beta-glucosyltransferase
MAAGRSIGRQLETASPGCFEVRVTDLSKYVQVNGRSISRFVAQFYGWSVSSLGGLPYRVLYDYADRNPETIVRATSQLFGEAAGGWLRRQRPDVLIATHPLVMHVAAAAFRDAPVGLIGVVTDGGRVNRLWWADQPHLLLVSHDDIVGQALAAGVSPSRVQNVGLLVDPVLSSPGALRSAKAGLGLRDDLTVLLAGGGLGFGPNLRRFAECFGRAEPDSKIQFLVATGTNAPLRAAITKALAPFSVTQCPVSDMSAALLAADLVIGKAGWLTLSECMTAGKPVIMLDSIPGQEEENARFAESLGVGRRMSVDEALRAVSGYARDPGLLAEDFVARQDLYNPKLGTQLATMVTALLGEVRAASA